MVESNKDQQEKAALTFTTVTVLFLPLTLLASIFGMNTNYIRNMNLNRWIFWVIGAPLCIVGLSLWLLYLGSFRNWARWLRDLRSKRKKL
jgi:Mg2+ and Co2+ transporter CorA